MQNPPKAFVSSYKGLSRVLQNRVHITEAFNPSTTPNLLNPKDRGAKEHSAIWDTGATSTVITQKIVDELGLKQIGVTQIHTANDKRIAPLYLVAIFLPNMVCIPELTVAQATVTGDAELLIGMDIISHGDFAVTNKDGKTVFSFRTPSLECIDFTKQALPSDSQQIIEPSLKVGRNDPCPCGSGKKYKRCHGR